MTNHRYKFFGAVIGFLFGILAIELGILKTVFVFFVAWLGYSIGKGMDTEGSVKNMLAKIFGDK